MESLMAEISVKLSQLDVPRTGAVPAKTTAGKAGLEQDDQELTATQDRAQGSPFWPASQRLLRRSSSSSKSEVLEHPVKALPKAESWGAGHIDMHEPEADMPYSLPIPASPFYGEEVSSQQQLLPPHPVFGLLPITEEPSGSFSTSRSSRHVSSTGYTATAAGWSSNQDAASMSLDGMHLLEYTEGPASPDPFPVVPRALQHQVSNMYDAVQQCEQATQSNELHTTTLYGVEHTQLPADEQSTPHSQSTEASLLLEQRISFDGSSYDTERARQHQHQIQQDQQLHHSIRHSLSLPACNSLSSISGLELTPFQTALWQDHQQATTLLHRALSVLQSLQIDMDSLACIADQATAPLPVQPDSTPACTDVSVSTVMHSKHIAGKDGQASSHSSACGAMEATEANLTAGHLHQQDTQSPGEPDAATCSNTADAVPTNEVVAVYAENTQHPEQTEVPQPWPADAQAGWAQQQWQQHPSGQETAHHIIAGHRVAEQSNNDHRNNSSLQGTGNANAESPSAAGLHPQKLPAQQQGQQYSNMLQSGNEQVQSANSLDDFEMLLLAAENNAPGRRVSSDTLAMMQAAVDNTDATAPADIYDDQADAGIEARDGMTIASAELVRQYHQTANIAAGSKQEDVNPLAAGMLIPDAKATDPPMHRLSADTVDSNLLAIVPPTPDKRLSHETVGQLPSDWGSTMQEQLEEAGLTELGSNKLHDTKQRKQDHEQQHKQQHEQQEQRVLPVSSAGINEPMLEAQHEDTASQPTSIAVQGDGPHPAAARQRLRVVSFKLPEDSVSSHISSSNDEPHMKGSSAPGINTRDTIIAEQQVQADLQQQPTTIRNTHGTGQLPMDGNGNGDSGDCDHFEAQLLALDAAAPGRCLSSDTTPEATMEGLGSNTPVNAPLLSNPHPAAVVGLSTATHPDGGSESDAGDDFEAQLLAMEAGAPGRRASADADEQHDVQPCQDASAQGNQQGGATSAHASMQVNSQHDSSTSISTSASTCVSTSTSSHKTSRQNSELFLQELGNDGSSNDHSSGCASQEGDLSSNHVSAHAPDDGSQQHMAIHTSGSSAGTMHEVQTPAASLGPDSHSSCMTPSSMTSSGMTSSGMQPTSVEPPGESSNSHDFEADLLQAEAGQPAARHSGSSSASASSASMPSSPAHTSQSASTKAGSVSDQQQAAEAIAAAAETTGTTNSLATQPVEGVEHVRHDAMSTQQSVLQQVSLGIGGSDVVISDSGDSGDDEDDDEEDFEAVMRRTEAAGRAGRPATSKQEERWWEEDDKDEQTDAVNNNEEPSSVDDVGDNADFSLHRMTPDQHSVNREGPVMHAKLEKRQPKQAEQPATTSTADITVQSAAVTAILSMQPDTNLSTGDQLQQLGSLPMDAVYSMVLDLGRSGSIGELSGLPLSPGAQHRTGILEYEWFDNEQNLGASGMTATAPTQLLAADESNNDDNDTDNGGATRDGSVLLPHAGADAAASTAVDIEQTGVLIAKPESRQHSMSAKASTVDMIHKPDAGPSDLPLAPDNKMQRQAHVSIESGQSDQHKRDQLILQQQSNKEQQASPRVCTHSGQAAATSLSVTGHDGTVASDVPVDTLAVQRHAPHDRIPEEGQHAVLKERGPHQHGLVNQAVDDTLQAVCCEPAPMLQPSLELSTAPAASMATQSQPSHQHLLQQMLLVTQPLEQHSLPMTAAVTADSNQVDQLTNKIHQQAVAAQQVSNAARITHTALQTACPCSWE